jgi:hypothetical protein
LRIDHLTARGAEFVDFYFAVKDERLAGLEAAFKIAAVKKCAGERASGVLHQQVVDGVAAVHAPDGLPAEDVGADGVGVAGLQFFNFGKADAVFVAERQVVQ